MVHHYLAFMAGFDAQQVTYTVAFLRESAHEWYMGTKGETNIYPEIGPNCAMH